ncbi:MAG TPA: MATE family efflux transporter [Clostridiales bacterium]|nr:MATE family efflux transporter [Clostridiales bacterium]
MENLRSAKMATMPVKKLLISMSLPAIFSMLVQSIYNVVDSLYLAQYSSKAITATGIVFPMQMLIVALGIGIGVGTNVYISKSLGEGKRDRASRAAQNGIFLALIAVVILVIVGFTAVKPFVRAFTNDKETADMGIAYLSICMIFSFGSMIELTTSKILQATGNMRVPMFTQLIGAVTNIVLDPFFIFGIGKMPRMGIKGAAIATVIGQCFAMIFSVCMLIFRKQDVHVLRRGFRPSYKFMWRILRVGLPSLLISALPSFTTIMVNSFIKNYDQAIAVLAVFFKLQSFVFMPVFGLTQGGMPIMSYNFGAYNRDRFSGTFRFMLILAVSYMLFGLILFQAIPYYLIRPFGDDPEFLRVGVYALRTISICFLFAAVIICATTMMQALGRGFTSLLITLTRQLVIIPSAFLLARYTGTKGVWFAYPIAEFTATAVFLPISLLVFKRTFNKKRAEVQALREKEEAALDTPADKQESLGEQA